MLLALIVFVLLLIAGVVMEEIGWRAVVLCVGIVAGVLGAFVVFHWPLIYYTGVLALVDIVLVLRIFKGDINIPF